MYSILVTESTLCPSLFVYYSIPKDLCFTYVTYFSISPYISEQMNRLWVCYEHLGVWCILISCDWILHLLPLLSGRWGNCPKLCKKFDAALIWQIAITKQLKIFFPKRDNHTAFWLKISLYPFLRNVGGCKWTTACYRVSRNISPLQDSLLECNLHSSTSWTWTCKQWFSGNDQLRNLRVTSWCKKVEACMDAGVVVRMQWPLHLQFLLEICLKLLVNVVNDWLVAKHDEQHVSSGVTDQCIGPLAAITIQNTQNHWHP